MFGKLRNQFKSLGINSLLITSSDNIFYLTGYRGFSAKEREAVILVTGKNIYLFTDRRYLHELKYLKKIKLEETSAAYPLPKILTKISEKDNLKVTGFEENNLTVSEYRRFKKSFKNFKPLEGPVEKLRELKTEEEIEKIKKACEIGDKAFEYIITGIKAGITEIDIEKKLEIFIKQHGAEISFRPIVAFGKNSSIPHHHNSKIKLEKEKIVLLDFGVNYNGYCSDMTRTVFFGSPTQEFKKMYETVLTAQKKAVELINNQSSMINNKLRALDIDNVAREYIVKQGYESIPHSLGHGIGIEVHEKPSLSPNSKSLLKSGMIFSIEPGIYLENFGGVRIEDLYLLTNKTLEKITHSTSEIISL